MAKLLVLLLAILPVVEIYLLVTIGNVIGFWPTVGLVLAMGAVGAWLARSEGLRVVRKWQGALAEGRVPEEGVLGGLLVLLGGVLLVIPGVLSDVLGLALLFPPTRRLVAGLVMKSLEARIASGSVRVVSYRIDAAQRPVARERSQVGPVIDVEGETVDATPSEPLRLGR